MISPVTVIKNDHTGHAVRRYTGDVIARGDTWICLDAHFERTIVADYVTFGQGDRVREWFYSDRWYNIFELHAAADDALKGWYCNLTRPARIGADEVAADDLALDVFVSPSGAVLILDEDAYTALELDAGEREAVRLALADLRQRIDAREAPFDAIPRLGG